MPILENDEEMYEILDYEEATYQAPYTNYHSVVRIQRDDLLSMLDENHVIFIEAGDDCSIYIVLGD